MSESDQEITHRLSVSEVWQLLLLEPNVEWDLAPLYGVIFAVIALYGLFRILLWKISPENSLGRLRLMGGRLSIWHPLWQAYKSSQAAQIVRASSSRMTFSLRFVVALLTVGLLMITLANPHVTKFQPLPQKHFSEVTISLVIENSVSFLLPDYELEGQPVERMAVVKRVLQDFVEDLKRKISVSEPELSSLKQTKNTRIGLVIFADQAYQFLPMTQDLSLVQYQLNRIEPYLAGRNDAAMGEALGLGIKAMSSELGQQPQHLILISDGLTLPSRFDLKSVVAYALSEGIKITTIGVGAGNLVADRRQFSGLIYQPIETKSLQYLAEMTGGSYLQVNDQAGLATVLEKFQGKMTAAKPTMIKVKQRLFVLPLMLSLMMLLLWGLLQIHAELGTLHPQKRVKAKSDRRSPTSTSTDRV